MQHTIKPLITNGVNHAPEECAEVVIEPLETQISTLLPGKQAFVRLVTTGKSIDQIARRRLDTFR
jgi:hypothetical protein